ncbi:MAG: hypothetical protein J0G96_00050 [Flavobacteriia bacterium]|nr:hypothetical protein [Flavobacteriia bacterium]
MRFLIFLILFIFCGNVLSQSAMIEGRCVSKNGKPLESVHISSRADTSLNFTTPSNGKFRMNVPSEQDIELVFEYEEQTISKSIHLTNGETRKFGDLVFDVSVTDNIVIRTNEDSHIKLPKLKPGTIATSDIGKTLVLTTVATSNNELTSNYTVRGGNYDENLVYVNDFIVNRPFLTRSGQQEGLNFVYSSLVESIKFSGGAFESNYGDKLSSVLDIKYIRPDSLSGSLMASMMGVESYIAHKVNSRFDYLVGARYRNNGYMLKALPTKGGYNPVYWDVQSLINVNLTERLVWSTLIHYSSNQYRFAPESEQTDFGTVNQTYRLNVYFEGQERSSFNTMTAATALKYTVNSKLQLDFYASAFNTNEQEYFDILGQYYINLLEKDPSKENFGDSIATVGVGSYFNHARNHLKATIYNIYHNGQFRFSEKEKDFTSHWTNQRSTLKWGVNYQIDRFDDVLSEWKMIDSAGYSIPQDPSGQEILMQEVIKGKLNLHNQRLSGYLQYSFQKNDYIRQYPVNIKATYKDSSGKKIRVLVQDTLPSSLRRFEFIAGTRAGYTEVNHEFYITPRAGIYFYPRSFMFRNNKIYRRNTLFRLSTGLYYQPPFYREFRTFDGNLNLNVQSQKSFHVVAGSEFTFNMWNRKVPFKFVAEAYYKYLWDVNPYEVDNVRTRYYADNNAIAYAYGIDFNINGEFLNDMHSFFKVGLMQTREDILNDSYKEYYNASGEKIIFGHSEDQIVADSATIYPGFIPRPTDQWMNFAIMFQDNMPKVEALSCQLTLMYNTRLPYGPPDHNRYADTLRQKAYFRVDFGVAYDFLYNKRQKGTLKAKWIKDAILSLEVYNLLGINNVLSHQWVMDVNGRQYAVPNYLTQRRFNLKLLVKF